MPFELEFIKWLQSFSTPLLDAIGEGITILAEQYVLIVILAFFYFVYNKKLGEIIAYSIFLSLNANNAIKGIVQAPRPFQVDDDIIVHREHTATGYSFPSGHTQAGAVFYTSIGKIFKNKVLWVFIGIIIFLIALSRLYLGVHFPKDVIVSIILGVGFAFLASFLYSKFAQTFKGKALLFGITALIFLPFVFIFYRNTYADMAIYRDFYTGYALFLGCIGGILIENKYVNFDCLGKLKIRLIRFGLALIVFLILQFGLKMVFPDENIFFDMIRYFLTSFVTLGLFPLTFRKFKLM